MTRDEVEIVRIEALSEVAKDPVKHWSGNQFRIAVRYVLANGETLDTGDRYKLKRDAVAALAEMPLAPKNPMKAMFHDGCFVGTKTSYWIGGAR